jgi:hypothetical protein
MCMLNMHMYSRGRGSKECLPAACKFTPCEDLQYYHASTLPKHAITLLSVLKEGQD